MGEVSLTVHTFRMGTERESALKPLEESAEIYGAWQALDGSTCGGEFEYDSELMPFLADEIADCITACVNLAQRHYIDLQGAIDRCESRNRSRGRYADER